MNTVGAMQHTSKQWHFSFTKGL